MPGGDRTGPAGLGPMTGRRAGYCAGFNVAGYRNNNAFGRGMAFRHGRGLRRGYGNMFVNTPVYQAAPQTNEISEKEEINYLKNVAHNLEDELNAVNKRLDELQEE